MNWIDLIIIALLPLAALHGWRRGATLQLLSLAGFWGGAIVGILIAPPLAGRAPSSVRGIIAVLLVLAMALVFGLLGEIMGLRLAHLVNRFRLRALDRALGIPVALAGSLLAIWLIGNLFSASRALALDHALQGSRIVRVLNGALPDVPSVFARIESFLAQHDFPVVYVNIPPELLPPGTPPASASVKAALALAGPSVVKITGIACSSAVEGSGFVAAPELVVTNAHVVAGDPHPRVVDALRSYAATPLGYDPQLDIAILRVPELRDRPLPLETASVPRGAPAAAVGYPEGGGLQAVPAVIRGLFDATGLDIYGTSLVSREIYTVNADIRPGGSGGPLVSTGTATLASGTVIGVVFARSATSPGLGYALRMPAVDADIHRAEASGKPVATGSCLR